jgi:hypothetical protein
MDRASVAAATTWSACVDRLMARADRLERLERLRITLEEEYLSALRDALQRCAAGSWGLFDHQQQAAPRAAWAPVVENLCDLGQEIDDLREKLSMEPFALHQEFEDSRGPVPSTAVGEPKQARAWLTRLES